MHNIMFGALVLALLALVGLLVLPVLGRSRPSRGWQMWVSFGLRVGTIGLVVAALVGPQWMVPSNARTVMFLLDRSDSVNTAQQQYAVSFIRQALVAMPSDVQAGLVVFGQHALIAHPPDGDHTLDDVLSLPGGTRTDIAEAMQLGLALLPADGQRRMVLLSDGGENSGSAEAAAQVAASRGVALEVVPLSAPVGVDTQITGVSLPSHVRAGQTVPLTVSSLSTNDTAGQLIVTANGKRVIEQAVSVQRGADAINVVLPEPDAPFTRYTVRLVTRGDSLPENNTAESFTMVDGRPHVLLVSGRAGAERNLANALRAAAFDVDTVAPAALPTTLDALGRYDGVVLVNVPLRALPIAGVSLLPAYVRDLGHGLAMIGGDQSFGAGGYAHSPVEEALPVTMDLRPQEYIPPIGVVVVMDTSASMGATEGSNTKMQLAATGIARIAAQLRDTDEMTVIPFDHLPQRPFGPLPGTRRNELIDQIHQIGVDGSGITINQALVEAARYIRASQQPVRHVIVLADGDDVTDQDGAPDLVQQLNQEGVTVTTLAIGDGTAVPFLEHVADLGGGRFFLSATASNVPNIMLQELQMLLHPYVTEGDMMPLSGSRGDAQADILRGITAWPPLHGYVASTPRPSAQVLLAAPNHDPLLVTGQYGLGHSIAWTSDLHGQWASDWVRWGQFPQFVAQMIGWMLPTPGTSSLRMETHVRADTLEIHAEVPPQAGRFVQSGTVTGHVIAADGTARPVTLHAQGPGRYAASLYATPPGTYQVQLVATRADGQPLGTASDGAVITQSREYGAGAENHALLDRLAHMTNGRVNPSPYALDDPTRVSAGVSRDLAPTWLWGALLLLPLELVVRRWSSRRVP